MLVGFVLLHLAPGDPVDVLAGEFGTASPQYLAQLRHEFGLDQPIYVQLLDYLCQCRAAQSRLFLRNDMSVVALIWTRLPATCC